MLCPPTASRSAAELLATVRLEANAGWDNGAAFRVRLASDDVQEVRLMS